MYAPLYVVKVGTSNRGLRCPRPDRAVGISGPSLKSPRVLVRTHVRNVALRKVTQCSQAQQGHKGEITLYTDLFGYTWYHTSQNSQKKYKVTSTIVTDHLFSFYTCRNGRNPRERGDPGRLSLSYILDLTLTAHWRWKIPRVWVCGWLRVVQCLRKSYTQR